MMAGTEMMRVADMSKIETIVDVGENDIPKVRLGDSALIEVDAYNNRKFRGIVTQIASSVTTASGSTTTVSTNDVTNYKVHIRLSPDSYKEPYRSETSQELPLPARNERQRRYPDPHPRGCTVRSYQCCGYKREKYG